MVTEHRITAPLPPKSELVFSFSRSSGPGGQNVNKVNSKATLRWQLRDSNFLTADHKQRLMQRYERFIDQHGNLVIQSDQHRFQLRNINECLQRLTAMILTTQTPPKVRRPSKPGRGAVERRLKSKRQQQLKKQRRRSNDD